MFFFKQHRVRAWNLIGHSEGPTAHVTTPAIPSLWTKPWRLISPWWRAGDSYTAASSSAASQGSAVSLGGGETASNFPQLIAGGGGAAGVGSDGGEGAGFVEMGLGVGAAEGRGGWGWRDVLGAAWSVLWWVGRGVVGFVKVLQAVLVLATLQTNLTVRLL